MAILEVKDLKKSFQETEVLRGVSFSLEKGNVMVIIGPSGGGKTTLLRCLNFLEMADSGEIYVNDDPLLVTLGKNPSEKQLRENRLHFGLVFQGFHLFPQYTALENVMLAPSLLKSEEKAALQEEAMKLLSQVGLSDKAMLYPWQLSGGQQQRVAIARALAMKPEILCFDEPTSALDPTLTAEVHKVILSLKEQGHTILVVTHEMAFAKSVADVVLYMEKGIVEEMGSPEKLFSSPTSPLTRKFIEGGSSEETF